MIKKVITQYFLPLLFAICFLTNNAKAQNIDYFQQTVNYTITATLNDTLHQLKGDWKMVYTNNSPDTLKFIYMHLWPNAYKSKKSDYASQNNRLGKLDFYFAPDSTLGYIKDIQFATNNTPLKYEKVNSNSEILKVLLNEPLPPKKSVEIATPYKIKIPSTFSRMGHSGQGYQISQWYPKPAVYDRQGWHPMPYLDMGEFFSEYGSFDVSITLPSNYIVAATGELQDQAEIDFLTEKMNTQDLENTSMNFPPSSLYLKTVRFTANNVHDFAWFADKRFLIGKKVSVLPSGKLVNCWTFYPPKQANIWKDAINYVERSVQFYSKLVGEYPYSHATAVHGSLSAGGGMEYPMITVISDMNSPAALDQVITHEVGHNWFYGILGSNERDYPWMDEGINSYYDHRYTSSLYEKGNKIGAPKFFEGLHNTETGYLTYLWQARMGTDQAPEMNANEFSNVNYFVSVYEKPAAMLRLMEKYLGTDVYDKAMQGYFDKWKFKHPYPSDLKEHLEGATQKDLSWFFQDMMQTDKNVDYSIEKVEKTEDYNIKVKNNTGLKSPFPIVAYNKEGKEVAREWYNGFEDEKTVTFKNGEFDHFVIDPDFLSWDFNQRNNSYFLNKKLHKIEPLKMQFLGDFENPKKTAINYLPVLGWNNYDKGMLGVHLNNSIIPSRKIEFSLTPMYSFATKSLVGIGKVQYNLLLNKGFFQKIKFRLSGQSFHYNFDSGLYSNYKKLAPAIEFEIRKKPSSNVSQSITLRRVNIYQTYSNYDTIQLYHLDKRNYHVNELRYLYEDVQKLSPTKLDVVFQNGKTFNKFFATVSKSFQFDSKGRTIGVRLFGGVLDKKTGTGIDDADVRFNLTGQKGFFQSQNDYTFDALLLDRNGLDPVFSRQIFERNAYMKTLSNLGTNNNWLFGANFNISLPYPLPKKVSAFFDYAMYPNFNGERESVYVTGVTWKLIKEIFEIHIPLWQSKNINDNLDLNYTPNPNIGWKYGATVLSRITFTLNLDRLEPSKLINQVRF